MPKNRPKVRVLWAAKDEPTLSSGYGVMGRHFLPRLAKRYGRENIYALAPVYNQGRIGDWDGITILPGTGNNWGEDLMAEYQSRYQFTFVLSVGDWGHLAKLPEYAAKDLLRWVAWVPYDYLDIPDMTVQNTLHYAWKVVPWTQYARAKFENHKLGQTTEAIPLGIDEKVWRPLPRSKLGKTMAGMGFEQDSFNILFIAANQRRKYLQEQMLGISEFRKTFPDRKVRVYMHTVRSGELDLDIFAEEAGIADILRHQDDYTYLTGGFPEQQMCAMINAADVVMNASLEGFGLSHIQAQACNIPVITLSEGPGTELVAWGATVPMAARDYGEIASKPIPSSLFVAEALDLVHREFRGKQSAAGRDLVLSKYTWDIVAQQWFDLIEGTLLPEMEKFSMYVPEQPSALLRQRSRQIVKVP